MNSERDLFVKKYREIFNVDKSLFVDNDGKFQDKFCQSVYEMWQASIQRQGYKLVPVVPVETQWGAGKAWDDRQAIIDQIEEIVRKERGHISYCETPRAKEMFKAILKAIGKPDPKETNSNIDEWANPLV